MAIPDSLASWRAYLQRPNTRRPQPPPADLDARTKQQQQRFDEARMRFLQTDFTFATPDVLAIQRAVRILTAGAGPERTMTTRGLAISGRPSMGKTTAALRVAKEHDAQARKRRRSQLDLNWQPTIYVVTPPATTPKMLMTAFCQFLGTPFRQRDSAPILTDRLVAELRAMETSLVVVDEIHNLQTNRQVGAEAASTLKLFAERLDATFVYLGVDLRSSETFSGAAGQQLASRMMHYDMRGYSFRRQQDQAEWLALIESMEDNLLLREHTVGDLQGVAGYLFDVTGGSIGQLRAVLRDAAIFAIQSGQERIDRPLLESLPMMSASTLRRDTANRAQSRRLSSA